MTVINMDDITKDSATRVDLEQQTGEQPMNLTELKALAVRQSCESDRAIIECAVSNIELSINEMERLRRSNDNLREIASSLKDKNAEHFGQVTGLLQERAKIAYHPSGLVDVRA
jgi:hypothetical protein